MIEKKQIIFDPRCFDDFEGTQEELDELVKEIESMFENGETLSEEIDLEQLFEEDPETAEKILSILNNDVEERKLQ